MDLNDITPEDAAKGLATMAALSMVLDMCGITDEESAAAFTDEGDALAKTLSTKALTGAVGVSDDDLGASFGLADLAKASYALDRASKAVQAELTKRLERRAKAQMAQALLGALAEAMGETSEGVRDEVEQPDPFKSRRTG